MTTTVRSPLGFTRRRLLALGAASLLATPAFAQTRIDVTEGNVAPLVIAIPDFVGGTPGDAEVARGISQIITANLRRSGLFAPIDPAAFIEKITSFDTFPRFPDWKRDQRAGAGHRPRDAPGRRAAQGRIPAVGRELAASSSPASSTSPARTTGAASRTSSRTRSTSASPARRAISTPASCSSTRPVRRSAASSASPSWIRTAPTCAISRAAKTSC